MIGWLIGSHPLLWAQHRLVTQVQRTEDDAEEAGPGSTMAGAMALYSTDLELVDDGSRGNQWVGLRFAQVDLPPGAEITYAYLQFTCDETQGIPGALTIQVQDTGHAPAFEPWPYDLSSRRTTDTSIAWTNLPAWNRSGAQGVAQRSPDLAVLLQHIVDRPDWQSGQAMALLISGSGRRVADAYDGDPQLAPQLVVEYLDGSYPMGKFPIQRQSVWRYYDQGQALPGGWQQPGYDAHTWAVGRGSLGYGNGQEATLLSYGPDPNHKHPTAYFRHQFHVETPQEIDSLLLRLRYDDGVVVYLNGQEVLRRNLPAGPISPQTLALQPMDGYSEEIYHEFRFPALLQKGRNLLAVEVHQASLDSDDLAFDLELYPTRQSLGPATLPFFAQGEWSYRDSVVNLAGQAWHQPGYDASDWPYGQAPLGYGPQDPATTRLDFGPDPRQKPMTAYFRREIFLPPQATLPDSLFLGLRRDDGAVVYVNGTEVWRSNMPVGHLNAYSPAASPVHDEQDQYDQAIIPTGYFQPGLNVIGVEVHQHHPQDEDLIFDLEIMPVPVAPRPRQGCRPDAGHLGCFTSLSPFQPANRLSLPATHRWQLLTQAGDPYSDGTPLPADQRALEFLSGGNLWLGHARVPAQVSQLELNYQDSSRLWQVSHSQGHRFDLLALGETGPLSGLEPTPWGHLMLSEGAAPAGDYNGDGRPDQGWLWSVDPTTGQAVGGKHFAAGRLARTALAVAADGRTVYFSGANGYLYKFVAAQYGDLSQGTLHVLRLNDPLVGAEPVGRSATWRALGSLSAPQLNDLAAHTDSLATRLGAAADLALHPQSGALYLSVPEAGRIYRLTEQGGAATDFEVLAGGQQYRLATRQGAQWADWGDGPGPLAFDDAGNLWVAQVGPQSRLWLLRPDHLRLQPQAELMATLPVGTRVRGLSFSADHRFLFLSWQNLSATVATQFDASFTPQRLDQDATLVLARREHLGEQPPEADFAADRQQLSMGENVQFHLAMQPQPDSVWWTFEGGFPQTSRAFAPEVSYATDGRYDVQLVVATRAGRDTLTQEDFIVVNQTTQFIALGESRLRVYPNPVAERLHLDLSDGAGQLLRVELYGLDGRRLARLHEGTLGPGGQQLQWTVPPVSGPALLRITLGQQSHEQILWLQSGR